MRRLWSSASPVGRTVAVVGALLIWGALGMAVAVLTAPGGPRSASVSTSAPAAETARPTPAGSSGFDIDEPSDAVTAPPSSTSPPSATLEATLSPTLLVTRQPSAVDGQVSFGGGLGGAARTRFDVDARGCITFGGRLVMAQPGSHVSADGRAVTLAFAGSRTHTFVLGEPVRLGLGGTPAYTAYPASIPPLADGDTVASCVTTKDAPLLILEGADDPTSQ